MLHIELTSAELVAIVKAMDRWPIAEPPPDGWWSAIEKIKQAADNNAEVARLMEKTSS